MGSSQDYPNVSEWVVKDTGYQAGEMVKYEGNIFKASYWAGAAPGQDPGWAIYDEMYDVTSTGNGQAKIIAYIPTWRKAEGFNYGNDEMYRYITHGIISFLQFSESAIGKFDQAAYADVNAIVAEVVSAGHRNGTPISIAIGGAVDYGFLYLMEKIGNNPSDPLLGQVVQNVANFVRTNNLDGVDLDLECWWAKDGSASGDQGGRQKSDGPHPAGRGLAEFARQLKEAMPDKIISAAVFATSWYGNNYDSALINYVDWVGIMSYDLTGSWNDSPVGPQTAAFKIRNQEDYMAEQQGEWPGPRQPAEGSDPISNNPIFSVEDSIWYWTNKFFVNWQGAGQNIPRNKIAGGVPIYGYDFAYPKEADDLSGQVPPGYKSVRYRDILNQFPDAHTAANANIKVPGSTPRPPFISAPGEYPYAHNIYFETPKTAVDKLNFLKAVGAQGLIIWELSNDVWEEGKSIIKALYRNSGNPETKPPILVEKPPLSGGKRYNERSYLCTHNAFTNYEDGAWTQCNQSCSITHQLERGVRALMLDTHFAKPSVLDLAQVIFEPGVYLLHGVNNGWIAGITYAKPSRQLYQALNDVGKFLKEHREEVVTIFLEDYSYKESPELLNLQILKADPEVQALIYNPNDHPDNKSGWKVKEKKQWPLLSDMIAWNKRLVIFGNRSENNSKFVAYDQDYIKENYWSIGDFGDKWGCPSRWDDGNYKDAPHPKLFVFNHFRNTPTTITAAIDNIPDKINDRINNQCYQLTKQLPNFVAVDFFELPLGGQNAQKVVDELNTKW